MSGTGIRAGHCLRVALGVLVLMGLGASVASAQMVITRGPIIQNPAALPTTMTLVWWTNAVGDSTVEYGTTLALGSSANVAQTLSCEVGAAGTCHTVPLTGLTGGTRYYYRLLVNGVEAQAASPSIYFTTLREPSDPGDIFFTVVGDWGQATSGEADVANLQNGDDPQMIITVGDNAYPNGTQSEWDNNALAYYVNPMKRALFVPTLGNHDVNSSGAASWFNSAEIKTFALPRNAPAGQEERYFSFDSGNVHFVVLDSNVPGDATQRAWLANDLATTTRKWKFVFLHHTPYSCANGIASLGSNATVRSNWNPLFEYYGVDVVFDGHDHIYERSKPLDEFSDPNGTPGTDGRSSIYVMTGGGGATLDDAAMGDGTGPFRKPFFFSTRENCYWLQNGCPGGVSAAGDTYCSYKRFSYTAVRLVNDTTLTVDTIDRSDVLFDTFTIVKGTPPTTSTSTTSTTSTSTSSSSTTSTSTTTSSTSSTSPLPSTTSTSAPVSTTSTSTSTTTTTVPCPDGDGDGVCDADDNCVSAANPAQEDGDADDIGDACDPCTSGAVVTEPQLTLSRVGPPPNDERFKLKGRMIVAATPTFDPSQQGARVLIEDALGGTVLDVAVPPGLYDPLTRAGWKVSSGGWQYRSSSGLQGLTKLVVSRKPTAPGVVSFTGTGKGATIAVAPGQLPLGFTVVVEGTLGVHGQCGAASFADPIVSRCKFASSGATLKCR